VESTTALRFLKTRNKQTATKTTKTKTPTSTTAENKEPDEEETNLRGLNNPKNHVNNKILKGTAHHKRHKTLLCTTYLEGSRRTAAGLCLGFLVVLKVRNLLVGAAGSAFLTA